MVRALRLRMRILVLHYITPALVSDLSVRTEFMNYSLCV